MNVKRKTVRFQDNLSDLAVYEAITAYKKYGFRSESHMVIEAVKQFIQVKDSDQSPEKLADLIAERLSGKLMFSSPSTSQDNYNTPTKEDALDAALNFLDSI